MLGKPKFSYVKTKFWFDTLRLLWLRISTELHNFNAYVHIFFQIRIWIIVVVTIMKSRARSYVPCKVDNEHSRLIKTFCRLFCSIQPPKTPRHPSRGDVFFYDALFVRIIIFIVSPDGRYGKRTPFYTQYFDFRLRTRVMFYVDVG